MLGNIFLSVLVSHPLKDKKNTYFTITDQRFLSYCGALGLILLFLGISEVTQIT